MRPQRTQRIIDCILKQDLNSWEAFIIGDGCPIFDRQYKFNDSRIHAFNMEHYGGYGFMQHNYAIDHAKGKYFIFLDNDDILADDHFSHYLSQIWGTDLDFVYFDNYTLGQYHKTKLRFGSVGHSDIIIRTDFLKSMPRHENLPIEDWLLIESMMQTGKYRKSKSGHATYHITGNAYSRLDPEGLD